MDEELWDAVREIVGAETSDLVADQRLVVTEQAGPRPEIEGSIVIQPVDERAAAIHMAVYGDTITFAPGDNGANLEIWSLNEPKWDTRLRELIRCVRAGRYTEEVKRGRIFALRVNMRFEGVAYGKGGTYAPSCASLPKPEGPISEGLHTYAPWE
jgi:hypothetical protein